MQKALFLFTVLLCSSSISFGQDDYETRLISKNDYLISIIQVFPDSFPKVTVVFQARNRSNEPLWLLDTSDLYVEENSIERPAIAVRNISENRAINVGLVFDHSASMVENPDQMEEGIDSYQDLYFDDKLPEGYIMSIDYAKEAVLQFFAQDKVETDSMFFIGFSEEVDEIPPLMNSFDDFSRTVSGIKPNGKTAFYDAVYQGIDSLKMHPSQPIIIALTDGQDNSSKHTSEELIAHAQLNEVPVYIIGLGDVHEYSLKNICNKTNGLYYHTNTPSKLVEIYFNIKKQIRSIYELDYMSSLDDSRKSERTVHFYFTNDTLTFSGLGSTFELPEEVMARIEARHLVIEKQRAEQLEAEEDAKMLNYSLGIGGAILGIAGFVVYRRKRNKEQMVLNKLYPNPFTDKITLAFTSESADLELMVTDASGLQLHLQSLQGQTSPVEIDLGSLESGVYLFTIASSTAHSNTLKAVKE